MMTRRGFLTVGVLGAAGVSLAACTGSSAPAAPASSPTSGSAAPTAANGTGAQPAQTAPSSATAAQIIFWPRSPSEGTVVWAKILPIAKKMFPQLTITFQAPPSDFDNKLLVAFAGGTAPDAGVTGLNAFRAFIGKKVFASIQSYVDADSTVKQSLQSDFVPAALQGYSLQGKLYGAPTVNEAIVLWYNKDAIVNAGLTPPREIQDDPAKWNWDTVVNYAKAINKGTGFHRERYGIVATSARGTSGMSEAWGNLVYAHNGRMLDPEGENWVFNGPDVRDALQYVVDLTYKYDVQPEVGASASAGLRDRTFFTNNQVGMVVQGEYFSRYLWGSGKPSNGLPFKYDLAVMPFCPATGKRTNIYHGNACFMVSQTKQPEATWDWLKVTLSQEAQQIICLNWGTRAANSTTYDQWLKTNAGGGPDGVNYQAIIQADKDTAPYPTTPYLTPDAMLVPTVTILYDNVFQNKLPVQQGLDQDAKQTTDLLTKAKQEMGTGG
jgi:multiple sugar transport system substrate-binding protein